MKSSHLPSLYTLLQTECDFTVESQCWHFQCAQISSSPPRLLSSSRPSLRTWKVSGGLPISRSLGASANQPFWVLRGRLLLPLSMSSQVVQIALGEDQRCRGVFPPQPGHAFQHLAMVDVAMEQWQRMQTRHARQWTRDTLTLKTQDIYKPNKI